MNGKCPECNGVVELSPDTEEGEILECPDCGLELEVIGLEPVQLEQAPQEEEDWGE